MRSKRILAPLLGGLAVLAAFVFLRKPPAPPPRPEPPPRTAAPAPRPAQAVARDYSVRLPDAPADETARAMDDATLRFHVQRLRTAAALGSETGKASARRALVRHGGRARALVQEEMGREPDPVVRAVLGEALNDLR